MSDKLKKIVEESVSSYFQKISWDEIVGPAILEVFNVKNNSDVIFVNNLVDAIKESLEDNVSGDDIVDEVVYRLNKAELFFQQIPNVEGGGYICSKCYRPHGVWASQSGNTVSDQSLMIDGKKIIAIDDL